MEMRRLGELSELDIDPGLTDDLPAGTLVEAVALTANRSLSAAPAAGDTAIVLQAGETEGLAAGQRIVIDPSGTPDPSRSWRSMPRPDTLTVTALASGHSDRRRRRSGREVDDRGRERGRDSARARRSHGHRAKERCSKSVSVPRPSSSPSRRFPRSSGIAPDPGNVTVFPASRRRARRYDGVVLGAAAPIAGRQATALALPGVAGATEIVVTDGQNYADTRDRATHDRCQRHVPPAHRQRHAAHRRRRGCGRPADAGDVGHRARPRPPGRVRRLSAATPLVDVEALDAGIWGNRLRISVEDETPRPRRPRPRSRPSSSPTTMRLARPRASSRAPCSSSYDADGPPSATR